MEPINVNLSCDIQQPVKVRYLDGYFFSKDSAGHRINVDVFNNGVPVSVGGSVSAEVIRSDGETVPVTGAVSENRAYVILPQAAYAVVGAVQITIKVTEGTTIVTIACCVAYVHESDTEITADPGTIIPSIQALISQIETAVASIPADYSSLWTSLAPAFSTSTAYAVGQYVTNSGVLYRFTTAHPAGTWNSAHVTAVNLGSDLSALKSAISSATRNINNSNLGRWGNAADGNIYSRDDKYYGMETFILVTSGESYTVSKGGISSENDIGFTYLFNDNSNQVIERAGYQNDIQRTLTVPAGATKLNVFYYSSSTITISNEAYIQIEKGTKATKHIKHITANDYVAREKIEEMPPAFRLFSVIDNSFDLDDLDELGAYRWNTNSVPENSPVNNAARMINVPSDADLGTGKIQIVITSDTVMFIRYKIISNWSAWVEVASKTYIDNRIAELFIEDGEEWED